MSYLAHVDDAELLTENPSKLQAFLDRLNDSVVLFGMRFACSKCKKLLQDCADSKPVNWMRLTDFVTWVVYLP